MATNNGSSFKKATKEQSKARIALIGPAGSGKTFTALTFARVFGKRIAVIDTEHGTAKKYSDKFDFDVVELETFAPKTYVEKIHEAEREGYDVIVVDSLSHAWAGKDGALEMVEKVAARQRTANKFQAWGTVTPEQNALVDALTACKAHLIVTVRQKMEYVQEQDDKGKTVIRKVGLKPIQRDGLEYEFDVVGDLDVENTIVVTKTRCTAIKGAVIREPGEDFARKILAWLSDGAPAPAPRPTAKEEAQAKQEPAPDGEQRVERDPHEVLDSMTIRMVEAESLEELRAIGLELQKLDEKHVALPALRKVYAQRKREIEATAKAA